MHGIGVGMLSRSPSALSGIFMVFPFASSPNGRGGPASPTTSSDTPPNLASTSSSPFFPRSSAQAPSSASPPAPLNRIYESLLHYLALVIPTAALGTVLETSNETTAATSGKLT